MIAEIQIRRGEYREALAHLEEVLEATPEDRAVTAQSIEALSRIGEHEEALTRLDALEQTVESDYFTKMLRAEILAGLGEDLARQGRASESEQALAQRVRLIDEAQTLQPNNPMPHLVRAQGMLAAYRRTGDDTLLSSAMAALDRADEVAANLPQTSMLRVEIQREQKNMRGVVGELRRMVDRDPGNMIARQQLVQALLEVGNADEAERYLEEATERYPAVAVWWESLGDTRRRKRDLVQAIAAYEQAIGLSRRPQVIVKLVDVYLTMSPPDARAAERLLENHRDIVARETVLWAQRIRVLTVQQKRDEALRLHREDFARLRQRISEGDVDAEAMRNWFLALHFLFPGDPSAAEAFARDAAGRDLDPLQMQFLARMWFSTGPAGESRAILILREAIDGARDPALRASMLLDLGTFHLARDEYSESVASYREVLEFDPDHPIALNNIAYVSADRLDRADEALEMAERAHALAPTNASVLDTLGWVYFKLGRFTEAEEKVRQAIRREETSGSRVHLAHILIERGNREEARRQLERALELTSDADQRAEIDRLAADIDK
jgi:tetratricopeptide (TPR) repeat protein